MDNPVEFDFQETGEALGPDLVTIGVIRETCDLLESVVLPSTSFARGFRPYLIVTTEGKVLIGVMTRESTDAITLRTATLAGVKNLTKREQKTEGNPNLDHATRAADAGQ